MPCLTLQQYASNPSRSQNIAFLVEPGMYNLSTVLTFSDSDDITISSTNATVTCTSDMAKFEFYTVENVHISGITFQGCRNTAITMVQVNTSLIVRSSFIDNQASYSDRPRSGGCLNIASSSVTISESDFHNNRASERGGAIAAESSTVIIDRSNFISNIQDDYYAGYGSGGGAISAMYSTITVDRSVFIHNYIAGRYGEGGSIYCLGSLEVNNTIFIDNRANGRNGGAIYATGTTASIDQCQFINNAASNNGGGLYKAGGSLIVNECHFVSNIVNGSGGELYTSVQSFVVTQCYFLNNVARFSGSGGGLYLNVYTTGDSINVTQCHFQNNTAGGNGGGLYAVGSNFCLFQCNFLIILLVKVEEQHMCILIMVVQLYILLL